MSGIVRVAMVFLILCNSTAKSAVVYCYRKCFDDVTDSRFEAPVAKVFAVRNPPVKPGDTPHIRLLLPEKWSYLLLPQQSAVALIPAP
jgi:hypothetical protein